MIIGLLGGIIFIGAIIALAVNNINTTKNPKPVTPEEKKKRNERNLGIGAVGLGALWAGANALERANRRGMPGWDLRPTQSAPRPVNALTPEQQQALNLQAAQQADKAAWQHAHPGQVYNGPNSPWV